MKKILNETGHNEISTVDKDARRMDNKNNGLDMPNSPFSLPPS